MMIHTYLLFSFPSLSFPFLIRFFLSFAFPLFLYFLPFLSFFLRSLEYVLFYTHVPPLSSPSSILCPPLISSYTHKTFRGIFHALCFRCFCILEVFSSLRSALRESPPKPSGLFHLLLLLYRMLEKRRTPPLVPQPHPSHQPPSCLFAYFPMLTDFPCCPWRQSRREV